MEIPTSDIQSNGQVPRLGPAYLNGFPTTAAMASVAEVNNYRDQIPKGSKADGMLSATRSCAKAKP